MNNIISHHESARKRKNSMKEAGSRDANLEDEHLVRSEEMHVLLDAKPSDFGTASGKVVWEDEEEFHGHDTGEGFHPFASAASSFFGGNSGNTFGSYYFGNFGTPSDDDDGNVQCQQM
jgi:hypothetical protein